MSIAPKPFSCNLLAGLTATLIALTALPGYADELDDALLADERQTIESDLAQEEADLPDQRAPVQHQASATCEQKREHRRE